MNLHEYNQIITSWKILYPPPPERKQFNPARVLACCRRCGSTRKLSRHHIGNDFYFAMLRPDLYAGRYIQFRQEDVVLLCNRCHKLVHKNYHRMMIQVKLSSDGVASKEWCDYWMNEFRKWFNSWIKKPFKPRKKRRRRRGKA